MRTDITRRLPVAAAAAATAALVAACSSGAAATTSSTSASAPSGSSAPSGFTPGSGSFGPAASGKIAAVTGHTMQVQNSSTGQTAVTWTGKTTFTREVTGTLAAVKVGECVVASGSGSSSAASGSAKVTSVHVTAAKNGTCTGGFAGRGPVGTLPSGMPTQQPPSGAPSGAPSGGAFPGHAGGGTFVSGKVLSVDGSTIVVAARQPGSTSAATTKRTLDAADATVTTTRKATAKDVAVGLCATAQGTADSTGAVTATSVALSKPTNGQCDVGFGSGAGR